MCARPDPAPRRPRLQMPALSCDSHAHVFGPQAKYAYSAARIYTPPDALPSTYRGLLDSLGVERAVLVQPSVYGTDNTALLDALAADPVRQRGVVTIDAQTPFSELQHMDTLGVRGVRCNIVDVKEGKGQLPLTQLRALAKRIRPLGWHLEFLMHVDEFADLDKLLADFPVDVVFGHLGYLAPGLTADDPGFAALLRLLRGGRAWVKLTGPYRISRHAMPHGDVTPMARALVQAAPERIVWGTDWPHVMVKGAMPNDGDLCDLLADWVPDAEDRHRVLVSNPARLYGFTQA
ncbi:MAG: amidohydrolase family protein [Chitinophagaceae bacterium]|nr:amidohydrolase family protein [Rubrivivax sp.]